MGCHDKVKIFPCPTLRSMMKLSTCLHIHAPLRIILNVCGKTPDLSFSNKPTRQIAKTFPEEIGELDELFTNVHTKMSLHKSNSMIN